MDVFNIISMLGGLALFLFGMNQMSSGLEKLSGGTLEKILKRFTSNIFKSLFLGLVVTAIIQSSSATTVLVVGLVNSGLISLNRSIGILMGANIGTTVTGQITRLIDIDNSSGNPILRFFNPETLAPFVAIIAIVLIMFCHDRKYNTVGQIVMGFSILFTGLINMSNAVKPLANSPFFIDILNKFSDFPLLALLSGIIITAIIQSSSACVGMLQALSSTEVLTFGAVYPIILGQNIGTCVTSILSSIGTSTNSKRTAIIHVYFNVIGTIIFMVVFEVLHIFNIFPALWETNINSGIIANFHTIFNITTTIILLPFAGLLEKLSKITIQGNKNKDDDDNIKTGVLDDRFLSTPSLALKQSISTLTAMGELSVKNCNASIKLFKEFNEKKSNKILAREDRINVLEDSLTNYIVKLNDYGLDENDSKRVTYILRIITEFERIGDLSVAISKTAQRLNDLKKKKFSEKEKSELEIIFKATCEIINISYNAVLNHSIENALASEPLKETIETLQDILKDRNTRRLKNGEVSVEIGLIYYDILENIEHISRHCSNISIETACFISNIQNRHEIKKDMITNKNNPYKKLLTSYKQKYLSKLSVK